MIVILNNKTHVGANPPSDTTKTWISADMTEISIYPEPETYDRLNERIDIKPILLAHNLDIKSNRIRIFSLADDVLEVKRYINGEWIVIDNPDNYVDIIMNGKVIGTMEVDSIAPGEQVEEWNGTGVIIEEIKTEEIPDELAGTWVFNSTIGLPTISEFNFIFISYSQTMTSLRFKTSISDRDYMYYVYGEGEDDEALACSGAFGALSIWNDTEYQTITITSKLSEVTNGDALLTWLKGNATKQGATNLITFTIDGTTYQAEDGMTWAQWVNSAYNTVGATVLDLNILINQVYVLDLASTVLVVSTDIITDGGSYSLTDFGHGGGV